MARADADQRGELLARELGELRRAGIIASRRLAIPEIRRRARAVYGTDDSVVIERLLRQAIGGLGGGELGDAAMTLLGLAPGTRGKRPVELRRLAARSVGVQPDTFRKGRERQLLQQIAEQLVGLGVLERVTERRDETTEDRQLRLVRLADEIAALPAADLGPLVQLLRERLNPP